MAGQINPDLPGRQEKEAGQMRVNMWEHSGMVRLPAFCLLAILFPASLAVTAYPGYFPDAVEAYDRGDYKTAYGIWKELADQGDAHAQNSLGTMYAEGKGVPQDYAEAVKWYRKSAEQGHAAAGFNLALKYGKGQGVPQDYAEAVMWYRRAAGGRATPMPSPISASCTARARTFRRT